MRHHTSAFAAAFVLLVPMPSLAQVQVSTADAIEALTRNDPATASRILTPSATSPPPADPLAPRSTKPVSILTPTRA